MFCRISSRRFKALASDIASIFPGELEATYYSPFKSVNKVRVPACGKLWENFNYVKNTLRKQHLIEDNIRTSTQCEASPSDEGDCSYILDIQYNYINVIKICHHQNLHL